MWRRRRNVGARLGKLQEMEGGKRELAVGWVLGEEEEGEKWKRKDKGRESRTSG